MTEFMNITELCRICMNAGVYLLSDQQLDMDGEEINSIDMLKEFSYNEVRRLLRFDFLYIKNIFFFSLWNSIPFQ